MYVINFWAKKMARVTIEDCLVNIDNAFDIATLASRRAKDLIDGSEPLIDCKNKPAVVALREIAEGNTTNLGDVSTLADPSVIDNLIRNNNE